MAEKSGFFNSDQGDRTYAADFFAEYFASFIGNGVYPNPSTACQVIASGNMTVALSAGQGWINGYYYHNTDNLILNLDIADGVLKRIDRIVLRYTVLNREIKAYVKKGTLASTPVAPALQRDADVWELGIADIFIGDGVVSVSQANITDLRLNSTYCGIVHGVVIQVDTTTIFNQFQAWYSETIDDATTDIAAMLSAFQNSFNAWFASVQDILDENTAGNLLNMINVLINRMNAAEIAIGDHATSINNHTADIASLDTRLDLQERVLTTTITTTWTGSTAPYTQILAVSGVTANDKPAISPVYSTTLATALLQKEAWNQIGKIDTGAGSMTITCFEDKPVTAIPIQIKGV